MSAQAAPPLPLYDSAARPPAFIEEGRELWRYRDLVLQWCGRNIKLRYKRSALGIVWTLLEPLMLMTILTVVFSTAFRFAAPGLESVNFPLYVLSGLLLFDFVSRTTLQIVEEVIASQSLARRLYVPRSTFALAAVFTYLVNWGLALLPLAAIMLWFDRPFTWALLTVPVGMLLASVFALGVGLLVATVGAFFHDVKLTYQVLLTAWFYATPIIYPLDILPAAVRPWFELNPLLHLCAVVRTPVSSAGMAGGSTWAIATLVSLGTLGVGWWVFTRWRDAFDYRS